MHVGLVFTWNILLLIFECIHHNFEPFWTEGLEEVEDYSRFAPYCYIGQSLKTKAKTSKVRRRNKEEKSTKIDVFS